MTGRDVKDVSSNGIIHRDVDIAGSAVTNINAPQRERQNGRYSVI